MDRNPKWPKALLLWVTQCVTHRHALPTPLCAALPALGQNPQTGALGESWLVALEYLPLKGGVPVTHLGEKLVTTNLRSGAMYLPFLTITNHLNASLEIQLTILQHEVEWRPE